VEERPFTGPRSKDKNQERGAKAPLFHKTVIQYGAGRTGEDARLYIGHYRHDGRGCLRYIGLSAAGIGTLSLTRAIVTTDDLFLHRPLSADVDAQLIAAFRGIHSSKKYIGHLLEET